MDSSDEKTPFELAAGDLFDFAIDRESTKWLLSNLPEEADINRDTVEYELQILRIIGCGWAISYFMESSPAREQLLQLFWNQVFEFSQTLSDTTGMITGKRIDYFQVLKNRLDTYVAAISGTPETTEPSAAIGPEFAGICGNPDDIFTRMAGAKMFMTIIVRIRQYLEAVDL